MNRTSFEKIKNNRFFQAFVISAIILSAFLVGVSTYNIPPQAIAFIYILDGYGWRVRLQKYKCQIINLHSFKAY